MKNSYVIIARRCITVALCLFISGSLSAQTTFKLQVVQPYYICETGLIFFRTFGGDGTPVTYSATGVKLTSPTSNLGIVEEAWRSKPPTEPILIEATQGDTTVSGVFSPSDFCFLAKRLSPVLKSPIPDTTLIVGESTAVLDIDSYFRGLDNGYEYRTGFGYNVFGVPPGMTFTSIPGTPPGSASLGGTPSTVGEYVVMIIATIQQPFLYAYSVADTFKITVSPRMPEGGGALALHEPTYNCQTGDFLFKTTGGGNTPIEYYAVPGITGWTTNPNQSVDVETRTAPDAQPITLRARQGDKEVFHVWNIRERCPVGSSASFRLIAPVYDCQSGAFTFKSTEGDGSPVEFSAIGITGWTLNPNQFVDVETRTAADAPPIMLQARQNGQESTYLWDIRAVCPLGSFRRGVSLDVNSTVDIQVLGNPIHGENVEVAVSGVSGEALQLQVINQQGKQVSEVFIGRASYYERVTLRVGNLPGMYLLRVSTLNYSQTVKVIKPN